MSEFQKLSLLITIVGSVVTAAYFFSSFLSQRHARKERSTKEAVELFRIYNSADFYSKVSSPVWRFQLLWESIEGDRKNRFVEQFIYGWLHRSEQIALNRFFRDEKGFRLDDFEENIYQHLPSHDTITPYESVSIFIGFWSQLWVLIDTGLVDRELVRKMFSTHFNYRVNFLIELGNSLKDPKQYIDVNDVDLVDFLPEWIEHIDQLKRFFETSK